MCERASEAALGRHNHKMHDPCISQDKRKLVLAARWAAARGDAVKRYPGFFTVNQTWKPGLRVEAEAAILVAFEKRFGRVPR